VVGFTVAVSVVEPEISMLVELTASVVVVGTGGGNTDTATVPCDARNKVVAAKLTVRVSVPTARDEPLTENVAFDDVAPAARLLVIVSVPEFNVTLPVGALPESACIVTVIVATAVCAIVGKLVATVIVVADVTITVVAVDTDALKVVPVELSPPYLAVMELLPQISELAATVILAVATVPLAVSLSVPIAVAPS
jgi:hypothetical protein